MTCFSKPAARCSGHVLGQYRCLSRRHQLPPSLALARAARCSTRRHRRCQAGQDEAPTGAETANEVAEAEGLASPGDLLVAQQIVQPEAIGQPAASLQTVRSLQSVVPDGQLPDAEAEPPSGRTIVAFVLPLWAFWILGPVLSLVDTAVVGMRSATDLAALGPGTLLIDYSSYVFTFLGVAVTNMLAVAFARKDKAAARRIISDGLSMALVTGVVLGAAVWLVAPAALQRLASAKSAALIAPALSYARIRAFGIPAAMLIFVTESYFLAAVDPLTPLFACALAGVVNLVGDCVLCLGFGWGIAGAAWATVAAQVVTAGVLLAAMARPLSAKSVAPGWICHPRWKRVPLAAWGQMLGYAGPIASVLLTKTAIYATLTASATAIDPVAAATHHVMLTLFFFFCTSGDACSQAVQSFLPAVIGSPRAAQRLGTRLMRTGVLIGAVNCLVSGSIIATSGGVFTNSAAVRLGMQSLLPWFSAILFIHTTSMVTEGIMLAGRDLSFLLGSYAINAAVTLGLLWTLTQRQAGVTGIWISLLNFQAFRMLVNGWRLLATPQSALKRTQRLPAAVAA